MQILFFYRFCSNDVESFFFSLQITEKGIEEISKESSRVWLQDEKGFQLKTTIKNN